MWTAIGPSNRPYIDDDDAKTKLGICATSRIASHKDNVVTKVLEKSYLTWSLLLISLLAAKWKTRSGMKLLIELNKVFTSVQSNNSKEKNSLEEYGSSRCQFCE